MSTIESNRLILDFMGVKPVLHNGAFYVGNAPWYSASGISEDEALNNAASCERFDVSWDRLMPVVEKIESLIFEDDEYYNFHILGGCYVIIISSFGDELITSDKGQSKLECVYKAVIEFILWYNKQNK